MMAETKDVLENLRLLKAFLRIKDPTVRRAIVELVERKSTLLTSEKKVPAPREGWAIAGVVRSRTMA